LEFTKIIYDNLIDSNPTYVSRADEIVSMFPDAQLVRTDNYWRNDFVKDLDPSSWIETKRNYLVLGLRRTWNFQESFRSTDYIPPSHSTGCLSACQYCYHARRTTSSGFGGNPMTVLLNYDQLWSNIKRHASLLGPKSPNQCDSKYWTYDIGNVNDVSLDAMISRAPLYLIQQAASQDVLKLSFATKTVNEQPFLSVDPRGKTRIRYSLMPQKIATKVDIRTSPISARIQSINNLVDAGYEVHVNFSPVIIYENCRQDWLDLFAEIDDTLHSKAKAQLACEVIFLTHNKDLHNFNLNWNPVGESYLWHPEIQEPKNHKPDVIRYKGAYKAKLVAGFNQDLQQHLPYCRIRYSF
jgi:DNA repair photolyase